MLSSSRNTVIRSLHDVGAAGWFGGALMGAGALNGASKDISEPAERARVTASGWARWTPFAAAAIAAHLIGGAGLQWITPVLTGALVVLGAQQGEQQRPGQQLRGLRGPRRLRKNAS